MTDRLPHTRPNSPAYCRPAAYRSFQRQLRDLDSTDGLFRAAFAIALHERPEAVLAESESIVEKLSKTVTTRVQSRDPQTILAHLHDVLFDVFGLRGNSDDYYAPSNSYLPDVLRTRLGIPITLVLIYKRVARPLGLQVWGVNAPGHFLAEVESIDLVGRKSRMYIDPFFGGGVLTDSEAIRRIAQATGIQPTPGSQIFSRATHAQWLLRMLGNLQAAFATAGRERDVYAMQELQALL